MIAHNAPPSAVATALEAAARTPGWSGRPQEVQTFALGACTLYVVPARRWINRRQDQAEGQRRYMEA